MVMGAGDPLGIQLPPHEIEVVDDGHGKTEWMQGPTSGSTGYNTDQQTDINKSHLSCQRVKYQVYLDFRVQPIINKH